MALKGKITISELSRIINVSRPTLYKYVEEYENDPVFNTIPLKILNLFEFIYSDKVNDKYDILEYYISNFKTTNDASILDEIKTLIVSDNDFKKKLREFIDNYYSNIKRR